jgi:hypothetical protein
MLRDIFTLGLSELGDWCGLNAQIYYATKLIQSCQNDLQTCNTALSAANDGLNNVKVEIAQYATLRSMLEGYLPLLRAVAAEADGPHLRSTTMANRSLDVAGFLGTLSAKAETVQPGFTAQEFAEHVLDVQKALDVNQPQGLIWDQPTQLQGVLQVISSSPVPAADVGNLV